MFDPEKAERKKEKRIASIMLRSIGAAGTGVGLFFLRFLVAPFLGENEDVLEAIALFSLCLIGFGVIMTAIFILKRSWLPKAYLAMVWVIMPAIALKLLAGAL